MKTKCPLCNCYKTILRKNLSMILVCCADCDYCIEIKQESYAKIRSNNLQYKILKGV